MPLCLSQGFAGPSGCVLLKGHEGPHKYGNIENGLLELEIAELRAQLAECQKDAARYRWLREQKTARTLIDGGFRTSWEFRRFIEPNELDAAIDAAMKGEK